MRWTIWTLIGLAVWMTGCVSGSHTGSTGSSTPSTNDSSFRVTTQRPSGSTNKGNITTPPKATIVTPAAPNVGRISLVRASAGYVIVTYTLGQLPARDSRLHVYRDGLKVAELKITELSRDVNAVAEVMVGECRIGDEVREH